MTVGDPEYVRGVCSVVGFTLAESGAGTCEEERDRCAASVSPSCHPSGEGGANECPDTTVDEFLRCWDALAARVKARYASVRCDDPSSALTTDEVLAEWRASPAPLPDACEPLQRTCPQFVAVASGAGGLGEPGDGRDGGTGTDASSQLNPNDPDPFLCGAAYRSPCAADKYCAFTDGCGTAGRCRPRDAACGSASPACGCDGKTYADECAAGVEGMGLAHPGPCGSAEAQFDCGAFRCDGARYCLDVTADRTDPDQQNFVCPALPDGCTSCACSDSLALSCFVDARCAEAGGHVTITCE